MPDSPDPPVAHDAYERLASGYDELGDTKPWNAYLERPATLSLVPEIDADRVLDAGCGAGHLTRELQSRGAEVVGLDASPAMLRYARNRVPTVGFVRANLGSRLPFRDDAFDGVASSLAFHYVRDWGALFDDLRRILTDDGWVVCSVQHPHADFEGYDDAEDYHAVEQVSATWDSFGDPVDVPAFRRPLAAMLQPALEAGFELDELVEPTPTAEFREVDPAGYERAATEPTFLCLRFHLD
ncbi:class I SAM-dependent methyltransferase [Haloarchaeobius amylolyticus]|uniref:class I SAM-dependent methyltransferase n=1 Tax=Haloarchaeobius amylolyticus TaxID=1198296 RepID=UPI00226D5B37|nr:methyltransferase domain-containing protein [Haloarchaeobius amylolyticus]